MMEPFNNFERWTQLKEYITTHQDLYQLLQEFMQQYTPLHYSDNEPASLKDKITYIDDGNTRRVYRIGKSTEYEFDCGFGKMVLACKVPGWGKHDEFKYTGDFFPLSPQSWSDYHVHGTTLSLLIREVQTFEAVANGEEHIPQDSVIPNVTGIIAGFGYIGTLTQDITHGATKEIVGGNYERVTIQENKNKTEENRTQTVYTDLKHRSITEGSTDYFFHRLQIDKPFSSYK